MESNRLIVQQWGTSCVTAAEGTVPVIATKSGALQEFELAFAVNFLRSGLPAVQIINLSAADAISRNKPEFDCLALPGETFHLTAKENVLTVTRAS